MEETRTTLARRRRKRILIVLALLLGLAEDDPVPRRPRTSGPAGAWALSVVE